MGDPVELGRNVLWDQEISRDENCKMVTAFSKVLISNIEPLVGESMAIWKKLKFAQVESMIYLSLRLIVAI